MKFTIIYLTIIVLVVPATRAAPNPNIFDEIATGIGNIGQDVIDGIQNAIQNGRDLSGSFANNIKTATQKFIEEAEEYGQIIRGSVSEYVQQSVSAFFATVRAFSDELTIQLAGVRSNIKRQILNDALNVLNEINDSAEALQESVINVGNHISDTIAKQERAIIEHWNEWASDELNRVASETYNDNEKQIQAEQVVNEAINRYSNYINSCSTEVEVNLQNYESKVEETIDRYQQHVQNLIGEVQECLNSSNGAVSSSASALRVRTKLIPLRSAVITFNRLSAEGSKLAVSGLKSSACVVKTLAEFELEKSSISARLNNIINEGNEEED